MARRWVLSLQQEGRILRQGNQNEKVKIFRYVTEGTFDSYSWQLIENKQKFIGQIMTSKSPVRRSKGTCYRKPSYKRENGSGYPGISFKINESKPSESKISVGR